MIRSTSKTSYQKLMDSGKISDMHSVVFAGLNIIRQGTDSMIAEQLGFEDLNKVRPRRNELVKMGLVEGYKKDKCPVTGMTVYWWRIIK